MSKRIAIYPISANPPTWGHADILKRATAHFEHVYWAAAVNLQKKYLFSSEERLQMMNDYVQHYQLSNVTVETYTGSTVRYAESKNVPVLIKGLRNAADFYSESEQAWGNRGMNDTIETVCLFAQPHLSAVSSSLVREIALLGESIEAYVLHSVADLVQKIIEKQKNSS